MNLTNSYIFLEKTKTPKKNSDGKNIYVLSPGITYLIHKTFGIPETIRANNSQDDSLENYFKRTIETKLEIGQIQYEVTFLINNVAEFVYMSVAVAGKSKQSCVRCLEHINNLISSKIFEEDYIVVLSYDSVSEYYCNKIYPRLNQLERTLRELMLNIYVVNFGKDYLTKTVDPALQEKAKSIVRARGGAEKKEIENIKNFFYALDYSDIQNLLFQKHWTTLDEKEQSDFLSNNCDLGTLSDKELRKAFASIKPKSDWERFFEDKVGNIDINELLEEIRQSRNNVAHCKFFYRSEYDTCSKAISKMHRALRRAIKITEEKEFSKKNAEYMAASMALIIDSFSKMRESLAQSFAPVINSIPNILSSIKLAFESMKSISAGITSIMKSYTFPTPPNLNIPQIDILGDDDNDEAGEKNQEHENENTKESDE